MNRRTLLVLATALTLMPLSAFAAETIWYKPGVLQAQLDAGKTVLVNYVTRIMDKPAGFPYC